MGSGPAARWAVGHNGVMSRHVEASHELARRDPVLAGLVERHGPMRLGRPPIVDRRFESVARTIVHQQLAGRAAQSIWSRVEATVGDPFTPEAVLAVPVPALRAAGLSGAKAAAVVALAEHSVAGDIPWGRLGRLDDAEVETLLTRVRGVGPWTAHMFLMFGLQRLDVWPTGDYGVRAGFARAWGTGLPAPKELGALGEAFRPYRSVVAWYCWRAVEEPAG